MIDIHRVNLRIESGPPFAALASHTTFRVFVNGASAGLLTLRNGEFRDFAQLLLLGSTWHPDKPAIEITPAASTCPTCGGPLLADDHA